PIDRVYGSRIKQNNPQPAQIEVHFKGDHVNKKWWIPWQWIDDVDQEPVISALWAGYAPRERVLWQWGENSPHFEEFRLQDEEQIKSHGLK
ncbi:hypothetical protein JCM5350_002833, partial [Sporobolomyces pararoseus]